MAWGRTAFFIRYDGQYTLPLNSPLHEADKDGYAPSGVTSHTFETRYDTVS